MSRNAQQLLLLGLIFLIPTVRLLLYWEPWKHSGPKMTAQAQVVSRRVEYQGGWSHFLTFALGTMELELRVSESVYQQLPEGSLAQIGYQGDTLVDYESYQEGSAC